MTEQQHSSSLVGSFYTLINRILSERDHHQEHDIALEIQCRLREIEFDHGNVGVMSSLMRLSVVTSRFYTETRHDIMKCLGWYTGKINPVDMSHAIVGGIIPLYTIKSAIDYYEGDPDKTAYFLRALWLCDATGILTGTTHKNRCAIVTSVLVSSAKAIHTLYRNNPVGAHALNSVLFDITIRVTKAFPCFAKYIISALDSVLCVTDCGTLTIKDDIHAIKTLIVQ